jgi:hypothetical protein
LFIFRSYTFRFFLHVQEKQLSINDLLKLTPKCIEINNGVVYEIRKNSASDEIATKTLAELEQLKII